MVKKSKMKLKFLRRDSKRFLKFGKGKGKKASRRKPKGRDNKMREKKKGYPVVVSIGYKKTESSRGKIKEKTPVKIKNLNDLKAIKKNEIGIIGKIGMKKKIDIAKEAKKMKIELRNMNVNSFLKKNEKKEEKEENKEAKK